MIFSYMDISPDAKNKVLYCSQQLMTSLRHTIGVFLPGIIQINMQEGTIMKVMESPYFPITLARKEDIKPVVIHGMCMNEGLGHIPPEQFSTALHAPEREIWTFKL